VKKCSFTRNSAGRFGGAIAYEMSSQGFVTGSFEISSCSFFNNTSYTGGAISTNDPSLPANPPDVTVNSKSFIMDSLFYKNEARLGGAVFDVNNSAVMNCAFSRNQAIDSGGALITNAENITNSTFFKNRANQRGGAILAGYGEFSVMDISTTTIIHCTFSDNKASAEGGAVYANQNLDIANSILWGNRADEGGSQIYLYGAYFGGVSLNISHSNLEGGLIAIGKPEEVTDLLINSAGGLIDVDPEFVLDEDLHLMPDSPCIV